MTRGSLSGSKSSVYKRCENLKCQKWFWTLDLNQIYCSRKCERFVSQKKYRKRKRQKSPVNVQP